MPDERSGRLRRPQRPRARRRASSPRPAFPRGVRRRCPTEVGHAADPLGVGLQSDTWGPSAAPVHGCATEVGHHAARL